MPRLTGLSDRDAGLSAKVAYFFTKRRFKQMTGLETATMLEPLRMYAYIPKLLNAYGRLELAEAKMDILSPRHRALAELKSAMTVPCEPAAMNGFISWFSKNTCTLVPVT